MKILPITSALLFITGFYIQSFDIGTDTEVYTNAIAEFLAGPIILFWLISYWMLILSAFVQEDKKD